MLVHGLQPFFFTMIAGTVIVCLLVHPNACLSNVLNVCCFFYISIDILEKKKKKYMKYTLDLFSNSYFPSSEE